MPPFSQLIAAQRKRAERDRRRGIVRIGGRWNYPRYAIGYLRAAEVVYDRHLDLRGDARQQLVIPCLFLIRHAVELALKQLVARLDVIQEELGHFEQVMGKAVTVVRVAPTDLRRLVKTHDLKELLAILENNLKKTGRGPLPSQWGALVTKLLKLEDEATERFRYPEVRWRHSRDRRRRRADRFKSSFPRERPVRIRELVEDAKQMVESAVDLNEERNPPSMLLDWDYEASSYTQVLYASGLL